MIMSIQGETFTKKWEQLRLKVYPDERGIPTIGWGNTRYPDGRRVSFQDPPITKEQADAMFDYAMGIVAQDVYAVVPPNLSQNQFDMLCDFEYNCGDGALHSSTLLKLVHKNPLDPAIRAAFLMWDKVHIDGKLVESPGLKSRRTKEADIYFT